MTDRLTSIYLSGWERRFLCLGMGMFLLLFTVPQAAAQPLADTLRLRSDDAVAQALAGGPRLLRQRLETVRAHAERLKTNPLFLSPLELELKGETDAPFEGRGEGGWEIGIAQEIELGGRQSLRREVADAEIARTEMEREGVERELRAEIQKAFAVALSTEDRLALTDSLAAFAIRLDGAATRLFAVGEISELDRNALHIERVTAEIERERARSAAASAHAELAFLLGLSRSSVVIPLPDPLITSASSIAALLDRLTRLETELAGDGGDSLFVRTPQWLASERLLDRLRAERSLAATPLIPRIRLGASLSSDRLVLTGDDVQGSDLQRQGFGTIDSRGVLFGLHLGIPLVLPFNGVYDRGEGEMAVADAEMQVVEADRRLLGSRLRTELRQTIERLRTAARAIRLYGEGIAPLIVRNFELLERGYTAGELSATQVITQQQQLIRIEEWGIEATRDYFEALADLERITE